MKCAKLKNKSNEEVSALDSALEEDIATLAPAMKTFEDDVQTQLEKEEEEKRKEEEKKRMQILERKRLEKIWRKRAEELYMSKKKLRKTLDEMVKAKNIHNIYRKLHTASHFTFHRFICITLKS